MPQDNNLNASQTAGKPFFWVRTRKNGIWLKYFSETLKIGALQHVALIGMGNVDEEPGPLLHILAVQVLPRRIR